MQGSGVFSYEWSVHEQQGNCEAEKQNVTYKNKSLLTLKYNDDKSKFEERNLPVIHPAPFEHPIKYSRLQKDEYISQFNATENDSQQENLSGRETQDVQLELCDKELWNQFSSVGTEMIVTKTGRRMFPGYRIKVSGLNPDEKYCLMMDIVNVDENRYKFLHGEWAVAGRGEAHHPQRFFLHPDSPAKGSKWMNESISFHKVKLTNSVEQNIDGKVVLNSMHRYQPRVHIVRTDDVYNIRTLPMYTFAFPQTVFITVTAYQNDEVTKLKINNNPFAKGFRDEGARSKKTKLETDDCTGDCRYPPKKLHHNIHANRLGQAFNQWPSHNMSMQQPHHSNDIIHQQTFQSFNPDYKNYNNAVENFIPFRLDHQTMPCYQVEPYNITSFTSTPHKSTYQAFDNSNFTPILEKRKSVTSSDSGIGWSPSASTDEDTSVISVGGPEIYLENGYTTDKHNYLNYDQKGLDTSFVEKKSTNSIIWYP
uniref:Tbx6 related protein n=1 Tax=Molgula tectiformis TaxID=30286 RepID=Q8MY14_MOLTE|nr:Tbx6 related protein [Molgula tectiformis]